WSGESSTRVVLDVEKAVHYRYDRISDPDRLWIDLEGTRLHPNLVGRMFPVGDGLLEKIRIGQNKDSVVRLVLDFKDVKDHTIFYLENPTRLVVDVRGTPRPGAVIAARPGTSASPAVATSAAGTSPEPFDLPSPEPPVSKLPVRRVGRLDVPPLPSPSPEPASRRAPVFAGPPPSRRAAAAPPPVPCPRASAAPGRGPTRTEPETPPQAPQVNRAGSYSLARQLGLGARKIVIDAGHGGHDPGTIGPHGLEEKDLVLDVAQRLGKPGGSEVGDDAITTRAPDAVDPLQARPA